MDTDFFAINRKALLAKMEGNSVAVLFCGNEKVRIGDEYYPFTPNRNFYYLSGVDEPQTVLLLFKGKDNDVSETLFIKRPYGEKARWIGQTLLKDEAKKLSGCEVLYLDELTEYLSGVLFTKRAESVYFDFENRDASSHIENEFAEKVRRCYPHITLKNLYFAVAELRRVKQDLEIKNIKKAIDITGEGVLAMLRGAKPDMYECEIEAFFDYALKRRGVKDFAFKSIVAGGVNAATLHYSKNDCVVRDGELVLCDVGAQWNYYNGDITRTFPVNGKFTDRQKLLYEIVLEGRQRVIDIIRPGIPFAELNRTLVGYYEKVLDRIGLIHSNEELKEYYFHSVSHMLGLETHDAGRHNEGLIEAGNVFTVEPGLYIKNEGIGIRIEDNVLVTENGCKVLSEAIPRTVKEIESVMNNG